MIYHTLLTPIGGFQTETKDKWMVAEGEVKGGNGRGEGRGNGGQNVN